MIMDYYYKYLSCSCTLLSFVYFSLSLFIVLSTVVPCTADITVNYYDNGFTSDTASKFTINSATAGAGIVSPSDVVGACPAAGSYCNSSNWLMLASGSGSISTASTFYNTLFDLSLGFETQFYFTSKVNPSKLVASSGFTFVLAKSKSKAPSTIPQRLGLEMDTTTAGIGTAWSDSNTNTTPPIITAMNITGAFSAFTEIVPNSAKNVWFSPISVFQLQHYYVYYNAPGKSLSVYGNGSLVYQADNIDLSNSYSPNSDNKEAYVGWTGGVAAGNEMALYITAWNFKGYTPANILITCQGDFTLYLNGTVIGSGNGSTVTSHSFSATLNPNDVVAWQAAPSGTSHCLVELRINGITLNTLDGWTCNNQPQTGWNLPSFNGTWAAAKVVGTNQFNSLSNSSYFRHMSNMVPTAQRLWYTNSASNANCRVALGRYCDVSGKVNQCVNQMACNFATGVCECPSPYFGALCNQVGLPAINYTQSDLFVENGNTQFLVSGYNFSANDLCAFVDSSNVATTTTPLSVNLTQMVCVTPPISGNRNMTLYVQRNATARSNGRNIQFYVKPVIYSFTPTVTPKGGGINITINGTNFVVGSLSLYCRFGSDEYIVPAVVINNTAALCQTPPHPIGQFPLYITRNYLDYSKAPTDIIFEDSVSVYCRNWFQSGTSEFSFVNPEEQVAGYNEAAYPDAPTYFPNNLFYNYSSPGNLSISSLTITGGTTIMSSTAQLFDQDYCCQVAGNNTGVYCGYRFNVNNANVVLEFTLPSQSFVNEFVTAWYDPCRNQPSKYTVYYKSGASFVEWTSRVSATSSCFTVGGDSGTVAICVDYASPVITDTFRLVFNSSAMPQDTSGAWLYEVSAKGISLNQGYYLATTNSTWSSGAMSAPSAAVVPVPKFSLGLRNVINQTIPVGSNNLTIQVKLLTLPNNTDVTSMLSGQYMQSLTAATASTIFSNLSLIAPPVGQYQFQFYSNDTDLDSIVKPLFLKFTVSPGAASKLKSSLSSASVPSAVATLLPNITICAYDPSSNLVVNSITRNISLSIFPSASFAGASYVLMIPGQSCVNFTNLQFTLPSADVYTLTFSSPNMTEATVSITVQPGAPYTMAFQIIPSQTTEGGVLDTQPSITTNDQAGNTIQSGVTITAAVFAVGGALEPVSLTNATASVQTGAATFTGLGFEGERGENYTMMFRTPNFVQLNVTIYVKNCIEISKELGQDDTGYSCVCGAGYQPGTGTSPCDPCPPNTFKPSAGSAECQDCGFQRRTVSEASTSCICLDGLYEKDGSCEDCVDGGVCKSGFIVGIEKGYWRPNKTVTSNESIVFYPCHRNSASFKEEDAAKEACPGADDKLYVPCSAAYTGPACLECSDNYGHNGPFCAKCPDAGASAILFVVCAIILLASLVFLVYQGRTPKNKESVSARILVNHFQMLALLSAVGTAWAEPLQTFLIISGVATFVDSNYLATECAVQVSFYTTLLAFSVIPLITAIVSAVIHGIMFLWKAVIVPKCIDADTRGSVKRTFQKLLGQYVLSVVVVTFVVYPAICIKVLAVFDCSVEIEGDYYLNADPSEKCYTSRHDAWTGFGYFMLFGFCIGVPLMALTFLWKFRDSENDQVQMVLRFFYDGYKPARFYWEFLIILRKLLIAVAIIVGRSQGALDQIYGFTWIVQAALIIHVLFHPYISGRQFRLEFWSLLTMLITLGLSLYIPTVNTTSPEAITLSVLVMLLNVLVVLSFVFLIGRGLARKYTRGTWEALSDIYHKVVPRKVHKREATVEQPREFFQTFAKADEQSKATLLNSMEKWWRQNPVYQRKRLVNFVKDISTGTAFEKYSEGEADVEVELPDTPRH